jgi:hypothetical protein
MHLADTAGAGLLAGRSVTIAMAAFGKPEENGFTDRLIPTIRPEEIDPSAAGNFTDADGQLGRFLDVVQNGKRSHSSLGYLTGPRSSSSFCGAEGAGAEMTRVDSISPRRAKRRSPATDTTDLYGTTVMVGML